MYTHRFPLIHEQNGFSPLVGSGSMRLSSDQEGNRGSWLGILEKPSLHTYSPALTLAVSMYKAAAASRSHGEKSEGAWLY